MQLCNAIDSIKHSASIHDTTTTLTAIHIPLIGLIFLITRGQRAGGMRREKRGPWSVVSAPNFQSVITHDISHVTDVTQALLSLKVHYKHHDESLDSGRVLRGI